MYKRQEFYRTNDVRFEFDSTVTGTRRQFATTQAMVDELALARIAGGMHFRYATMAGSQLGDRVGTWVATQAFARRYGSIPSTDTSLAELHSSRTALSP